MGHALVSALGLLALAAMLAAAVVTDIGSQRIPNRLVAGGLAVALILSACPGGIGVTSSVLGLLTGFMVLLPFHLLRVTGAGDVKLLAAVGAFVGLPGVLMVALGTFVAGGLISLAWALRNGRLGQVLSNLRGGLFVIAADMTAWRRPVEGSIPVSRARIPYAVAIAAGTMVQVLLAGLPAWRGGF